jgi:hypothetical protein
VTRLLQKLYSIRRGLVGKDTCRRPIGVDLASIGTKFEGVNVMKRRKFVLVLLGTALLPACSADAAESVVIYKDAS